MAKPIDLECLAPWLPARSEAQEAVLVAFEEAVLRHGLQGASFARIAEQGGFHRSLIQHHFGTREQLLAASLERLVDVYGAIVQSILAVTPPQDRTPRLLDWLCRPFGPEGPPREALVVDAFQALAGNVPDVARRLAELYGHFAVALAGALAHSAPDAASPARQELAHVLISLSIGRACLDTLGFSTARGPAVRQACQVLIEAL